MNQQQNGTGLSWDVIREELSGVCRGNCNLGLLATGRNIQLGRSADTALIYHGDGTERTLITYAELELNSNRFAYILNKLDVRPKAAVFYLGERIPEIFTVILGTLKNRNVFCPLFDSFGIEPLQHRLSHGEGVTLVCSTSQFKRKIEQIRGNLPKLLHILLVDSDHHLGKGVWSLPQLMAGACDQFTVPQTRPEDPALLHFTSGTTSLPKGVLLPHEAAVCHILTGRQVFNMQPGDIFWCTADPGWVTGTVYTILTPLLLGATTIMDREDFSVARWLEILETDQVNIFYTSPSAIRRLQRVEESTWANVKIPDLRAIHSVGEPLSAPSVLWGQEVLGLAVRDSWWQTETGSIMIANSPGLPIKPGAMGKPVPGIRAEIVDEKTGLVLPSGQIGMLALAAGWPSQFTGYLGDQARYDQCFKGRWYLSGDLAMRDRDGYFWFKGRRDDMIKSSGHLISPFEVEAVLDCHPGVAESAVFGIPDDLLGERVVAAVTSRKWPNDDEKLRNDVLSFARQRLGPALAPREIDVVDQIPKNRAGKVMRRVMRAEKLGTMPGDLSTLASPKRSQNNSTISEQSHAPGETR